MVSFQGRLRSLDALDAMGRALRHRGPDDHLLVVEPDAALGTERLRITDIRPEGAQPFTDPSSRVWLSCNGAIYNAEELRRRYSTYPFRSRSDVETLLPLYLDRGPEGLTDVDGMFAIAVWDGRKRQLTLARDRAGEKPLFYTQLNGEVWFASEVQALLEHPSLERGLSRHALAEYLRLGYVREPRTLFRLVRKVESGTTLAFTEQGQARQRYWEPDAIAVEPMTVRAAEQRLEQVLVESVRKQVQANVPIGVFTSGGVDSALLAILADEAMPRGALRTFTVGFPEGTFDERSSAGRVADLVGSRHFEVCADEQALATALDHVTERVAEPIADPAILPTYLLAQAAREHVGVVLSGEGADELFGGYPTYLGHAIAPKFNRLPRPIRSALASLADLLPPSQSKVPLEFLLKRFVAHAELGVLGRHVAWFGTGLPADVAVDLPASKEREWFGPDLEPLRQAMLFDYRTYLPDDLLAKVDRATMLASLEARSPYLDREVTTFGLALDSSLKIRGLKTKWLLKKFAEKRLPHGVVHRRKRGLSVPIGAWINGGLRAEVDRLLSPKRLQAASVLNAAALARLLYEHRSGHANHGRALWAVVILERWRERWAKA
jgi:asparagine synthase (glutamine-hydrolysing)